MSIPILITKIVLPAWREEIFSRKRLTTLFEELLDYKLIIVSAPAGYGKTSLLLDIAHHNELPFCWYTLDSLDQEADRFLTHFIASIARKFPAFGEQSVAALQGINQGKVNIDEIDVVIVNEIYQAIREHFVMVLDDYQMVESNQTINKFINRFVQNVDLNCHLVITSRSALPLPDLSLMVGRSLVGGLGMPELAFQPDEIQALMLKNYQQAIPDAIAIELAKQTEGWITGLLLSAQTMWQGMVDQLRLARVSGVDLYGYLVEQVLNQQPPVMRDFLLKTSFLDEFDAELCDAFLGNPPASYTWQGILEDVVRRNLFVMPVGETGNWLHYHRLFSEFLQAQYIKEQPAEVNDLLFKLVDVFAEREDWEKAYSYCQRLGKPEITADLLEKAGEVMVLNGRISLLRGWLEDLPLNLLDERPILLARYGIVLATQKETSRGLALLDRSIDLLRTSDNQIHLAGTLVWRALTYYLRGEYIRSLNDVSEVFSLIQDLPRDLKAIRFQAEAQRISGQCYRMMGDLTAATHGFNEALYLFKQISDQAGINRILLLLGALNVDIGNTKTAMIYYQQVLDYYQKQHDIFSASSVLNEIAYIHYLKGDYCEAFVLFNKALAQARQSGNARVEGFVLIGMGDIFSDLADYTEAQNAYAQGRLIVESIKDTYLLIYICLTNAAIARHRADNTRAHIHLNSANQLIHESKAESMRGMYLLQAGLLAITEKDYILAAKILIDAYEFCTANEQRIDEIRARCLLSAALYEQSEITQAFEHLDKATRLAAELDDRNILIQAARQTKEILMKMADLETNGLSAIQLLGEVTAFEEEMPKLKKKLRAQDSLIIIKPPSLRIQAFGQIRVTLDEKLVTGADWQVMVTRDLLFLTLNNKHGWSKEKIGECLWPESSPSQINQRFKNSIYRLRRALNQDVIEYFDGKYSFNRKVDYTYDVEEFEYYLDQAALAKDIEAKITAYQSAVHIYEGDYLPDMDKDWVLPERERLQQAYLNAGIRLAGLLIDIKQFTKALELCNQLISFAPWLEEAYCIAMNLYAFKGNRAAIAQLYKGLRQELWDYSDTYPSLQTESLYRSLMG
jgi:ATP/maltotriose-dependent transcriptional regulator MalT